MITSTILTAFITFYAATGNPTASGLYPFEGTIACPRSIPLSTIVEIEDERYLCLDRTAKKYDGRFDIFSNKPTKELLKLGKRKVQVKIIY